MSYRYDTQVQRLYKYIPRTLEDYHNHCVNNFIATLWTLGAVFNVGYLVHSIFSGGIFTMILIALIVIGSIFCLVFSRHFIGPFYDFDHEVNEKYFNELNIAQYKDLYESLEQHPKLKPLIKNILAFRNNKILIIDVKHIDLDWLSRVKDQEIKRANTVKELESVKAKLIDL